VVTRQCFPLKVDFTEVSVIHCIPSVTYAEKHMLNFHTVALTLCPYVGLEACAEKMVNVVLDYNSANTADGGTTIFIYFTV